MADGFKQVKSSESLNLDELIALNEQKKLNLEAVNKEVEGLKLLAEHKVVLEASIQKFEDYILKMKSRCEKKKEVCEQLVEELKQKEFVLKTLEEEVSKKQALYGAQGYDGKKRLNYFESQKKDLGETLDKKRAVINELQDKLWESEIQYKRNMYKVIADGESFRNMYNSVADQSKTLLQPLVKIKIPQIQNLCSTFHFEFPDWTVNLNKCDASLRKSHRDALNEIDQKIQLTGEVLNRMHDSLKEQLNEMNRTRISTFAIPAVTCLGCGIKVKPNNAFVMQCGHIYHAYCAAYGDLVWDCQNCQDPHPEDRFRLSQMPFWAFMNSKSILRDHGRL